MDKGGCRGRSSGGGGGGGGGGAVVSHPGKIVLHASFQWYLCLLPFIKSFRFILILPNRSAK